MLWLPEPGRAMHTPSALRKLAGHYEIPQSSAGEGWALPVGLAIRGFAARVAVKTILDIPDPAKRIKKHSIVGSGVSLPGRKFSFYIPGRDQIGLSSFGQYV
ncbi:MAG TPA: hypothetical protein VN901_02900 [Candidatus Acidoferrales bacterium]|nr:hypothetical protein [Candidatus Acidoferrales bacterium]